MIISRIEKLVHRIPVAGSLYQDRYCQIRRALFRINRKISLFKYPRYVHFLVTYDCNFKCKQCQVSAGERKIRQLSFEEAAGIIGQVRRAGVKHLVITGGEPLVRSDTFNLLRYANDIGTPFITLATNGFLVERYRKELSHLKIDKVVTSIDGDEKWNDELRGKKGAFRGALRALEIFREMGVADREVNTTVLPGCVDEMKRLSERISTSAVTRWVLGTLIPIGRARSLAENAFSEKDLAELIQLVKEIQPYLPAELMSHTGYLKKYYKKVASEPFCCRAGWETCAIEPDGEVVPCNMVSDRRFSQGNLRKIDFTTIWNERFKELRDPKLPAECRTCDYLNACFGGCWAYRAFDAPYCYRSFC